MSPGPRCRILCTALALAAGAASAGPLDFVPADSPYFVARAAADSGAALDVERALASSLVGTLGEILGDGYCELLACDYERTDDNGYMLGGPPPALALLFEQLRQLTRPQQWALLGLAPDGELAVYGQGLLPAVRIQLADAEKFRLFVATLEEASGAPARQLALADGGEAWLLATPAAAAAPTEVVAADPADPADADAARRIGAMLDADLAAEQARRPLPALLLALQDGAMVATFAPATATDEELAAQLAPPPRALGRAGLQALGRRQGMDGRGLVWLDTVRLQSELIRPAVAADRRFREAFGLDGQPLAPQCQSELLQLAARLPKLAFGIARSSASALDARLVVELEAQFAGPLSRASRVGPKLEVTGHVFDLGLALDFAQFFDALGERARQSAAMPFLCPQFAEVNQAMTRLAEWSASPLLAPWRSVRSVRLEMAARHPEQPALTVESADPQALAGALAMLEPGLATLQLVPDGKPVLLKETEQGAVLVALLPDRFSMAKGSRPEIALQRIASAPTAAEAPAFSLRLGPWLLRDWQDELKEGDAWEPVLQRLTGVLVESRLSTRGVETLLRFELQGAR